MQKRIKSYMTYILLVSVYFRYFRVYSMAVTMSPSTVIMATVVTTTRTTLTLPRGVEIMKMLSMTSQSG